MKEIQPNIMGEVAKVFISLALLGAFGLFFRLYNALVVKPEKLKSIMRKIKESVARRRLFCWET